MTSICCVCNKIKQQGGWIAAEVFVGQEQLSHGYCPACYAEMLVKIHLFPGTREICQSQPVSARSAADCSGACA